MFKCFGLEIWGLTLYRVADHIYVVIGMEEFKEINIEKVEDNVYLIEVFWEREGEEWSEYGELQKPRYTDGWVLLTEDGEPLGIFKDLHEAKEKSPYILKRFAESFLE